MDSDSEEPLEIFQGQNVNQFRNGHSYNNHNQGFEQPPPYQYKHQHSQQNSFNQRGRGQHRFRGNYQQRGNNHRGNFRNRGPQNYRDNRPQAQWLPNPCPRYGKHQTNRNTQNDGQGPRTEHSPWMTPEILAMIQEKDKVQNEAFATQNQDDFRILKALRGRLNIAINDAKYMYNEKLKEAKNMKALGKKSALYCDPCDRAFPDEHTFKEHKDEHITCKLDGCTFTAHPKIILKHIQMQHSNDLFFRVKGYDTPEQIEKWKNERKSRFPTEENIERKKAELIEKRQRGEIMGIRNERKRPNNRFSLDPKPKFNVNRERTNFKEKKRRSFKKNVWHTEITSGISSQNCSSIITLDSYYSNVEVNDQGELVGKKKIKWVNGKFEDREETSDSENEDEHIQITDDEDENMHSNINLNLPVLSRRVENINPVVSVSNDSHSSASVPAKPTGLLGLVAYSSDSEVEEKSTNCDMLSSPPKVLATNDVNSNSSSFVAVEVCQKTKEDLDVINNQVLPEIETETNLACDESYHELEKSVNVERKATKLTPEANHLNGEASAEGSRQKKDSRTVKKSFKKPHFQKSTLPSRRRVAFLERLLKGEINTERNYIMQACQYIEEHNFFEEKSSMTSTNSVAEKDSACENIANEEKQTATIN